MKAQREGEYLTVPDNQEEKQEKDTDKADRYGPATSLNNYRKLTRGNR
jgi:hypothetical protein